MDRTVKTGLVGFGLSGRAFQAPFLHQLPHFELTTVVERHRNDSQDLYPYVEVVRSFEELLQDESIELVVITTPNTLHYEMARKALEAGKHVVLEKPFTVDTEEARKLLRQARAANRVLTVYQNRRFDGDFMTIQKLLEQEKLGKLVEYEAHFDTYRPRIKDDWREKDEPGSGILFDLGSHLIDQALLLFGLPDAVTAEVGMRRPGAVTDDYFDLRLHYDGLTATLKAGKLVKQPGPQFILHGTEGSFLKHGRDPQEALLRNDQQPYGNGWGEEPANRWGSLETMKDGMEYRARVRTLPGDYGIFYRKVYEAIVNGEEPPVKPLEAFQTIQVIEKARESSEAGKRITL